MEPVPEGSALINRFTTIDPLIKVLLVEDNPGDMYIMSDLLQSSDIRFKLTHVTTLKESLACFKNHDFDIVFLDLGLPDSVGLETLRTLKAAEVKSPVVVMTGLDDEETALASLREGAMDYLVKNKLTSDYIVRSIKYSIERNKILNLQKRHISQFSFRSTSTSVLNEYEDISLCIKVICHNLNRFLDKADVLALELVHSSKWKVSCVDWLEPRSQQIKFLSGWDINQTVFRNTIRWKYLLESFRNDKLHEIEGGIYEITGRCIARDKCIQLENILNVTHLYSIGFLHQKDIYGGFVILSQNQIENDDIEIIESISNRISAKIRRSLIENDLRISENRFKKLNKNLELKVKARTIALEQANKKLHKELSDRILAEEALKKKELQLKELNATKDKFFNIVAHDLKNPFTSMLGSSELLYQNIHRLDNEEIIELATVLNDSAKSGYSILQNLLDWSRSQTGLLQVNPEQICLSDLIDENIANFRLLASNKDILVFSESRKKIKIFADAKMINTILRNLLSNAIKFTHRGGKITVNTFIHPQEILVSVNDNGTGISRDRIDSLFRIDVKHSMPGTENEQGTGLGLKLCKEFTEKLGGKIWVESVENKGSEFKFTIPVHESVSLI